MNNHAIARLVVNGDPWIKAKEVASGLGYANTKQAIIKNVDDDDDKLKMEDLLDAECVGGLPERPLDSNDRSAIFINKPSLYSLILRIGKQESKGVKKWVCSEVMPSIKKYGAYVTMAAAVERIRNPTGETNCTTR